MSSDLGYVYTILLFIMTSGLYILYLSYLLISRIVTNRRNSPEDFL
jgi:hypothetical protein